LYLFAEPQLQRRRHFFEEPGNFLESALRQQPHGRQRGRSDLQEQVVLLWRFGIRPGWAGQRFRFSSLLSDEWWLHTAGEHRGCKQLQREQPWSSSEVFRGGAQRDRLHQR